MITSLFLGTISASNTFAPVPPVTNDGPLGAWQDAGNFYNENVTVTVDPVDSVFLVMWVGSYDRQIDYIEFDGRRGDNILRDKKGTFDIAGAALVGGVRGTGVKNLNMPGNTNNEYRLTFAIWQLEGASVYSNVVAAVNDAGSPEAAFTINTGGESMFCAAISQSDAAMGITTDLDRTDLAQLEYEAGFWSRVDSTISRLEGTVSHRVQNGTRGQSILVGVGPSSFPVPETPDVYHKASAWRFRILTTSGGVPQVRQLQLHNEPDGDNLSKLSHAFGSTRQSTDRSWHRAFEFGDGVSTPLFSTNRWQSSTSTQSNFFREYLEQDFGDNELELAEITYGFNNDDQIGEMFVDGDFGSTDGYETLMYFRGLPETLQSASEVAKVKMPLLTDGLPTPGILYLNGVRLHDRKAASTSLFASKGTWLTCLRDLTVRGADFYIGNNGTGETGEIVLALITNNASDITFDTILARKSYVAKQGFNSVRFDTPQNISAGQTFAVMQTRTDAASDATSSDLYVINSVGTTHECGIYKVEGGARYTSRDIQAGFNSTDKNNAPWACSPVCEAQNTFFGLGHADRYWRFINIDASGSTGLTATCLRLLDANGFPCRADNDAGNGAISLGPSTRLRCANEDTGASVSFGTTDAGQLQYDFGRDVTPAWVQFMCSSNQAAGITDFLLQSSPNGSTWTDRFELYGEPAYAADYDQRWWPIQ